MSSNKKSKAVRMTAFILCIVISLVAVFGAGAALYLGAQNNGWFDKTLAETDNSVTSGTAESAGDMYVSESTSNGITLTAAKLTADEYEEYGISAASVDSAYTLTASYNSTASNPLFDWLCSNINYVTVTPSSNTRSCVVTCISAFSSAITITCVSRDNTSVNATCTVNYVKRITSSALTLYDSSEEYGDSVYWSSGGSTVTWNAGYGLCTSGDTVIAFSTSTSLGTGTTNESYSQTVTVYSNITNSTVNYNESGSYSGTFRKLIACITGVSVSLSNTSFKSSVYSALISKYNSSSPAATITVTFTGGNYGATCSFNYYLIINPGNFA